VYSTLQTQSLSEGFEEQADRIPLRDEKREGVMKLRMPWQKDSPAAAPTIVDSRCTHPRVEVEMHGTVVKRRWCAVCGEEIPLPERESTS
jgi:hypothetical protein